MKCPVTVDLRNVFFTQCLKLSFCKRVSVVKHDLRSHMAHSSQAQKILQDKSVFEAPTLGISMNM